MLEFLISLYVCTYIFKNRWAVGSILDNPHCTMLSTYCSTLEIPALVFFVSINECLNVLNFNFITVTYINQASLRINIWMLWFIIPFNINKIKLVHHVLHLGEHLRVLESGSSISFDSCILYIAYISDSFYFIMIKDRIPNKVSGNF